MNSVMNNESDKKLKRLEDDTEFEEFEDYGKIEFIIKDWECKDANEELNFNEWNKNFEDDENLDRLESMLKEEITKYKANNK